MKTLMIPLMAIFLGACATTQPKSPAVSILVDLDPASVDRTVIVESITADQEGRLYMPDRVTGNILRVDPKSPKPVVVGRIEAREIKGKKVNADGGGIAFNQQGDLFIASGPFAEVLRIRAADLNTAKPGTAQTFATGTEGANGIAFDRQNNLYVAGGRSGIVYPADPLAREHGVGVSRETTSPQEAYAGLPGRTRCEYRGAADRRQWRRI